MRLFVSVATGLVVPLLLATSGWAEVVLPNILSHHMVLQRDLAAPIWGLAAPGEKVSVRGDWQAEAFVTTAGANGRWQVKLPTPAPGGPYTITITGTNRIVLTNVLVGEVWICSGQSNMEMPVGDYGGGYGGATNWEAELRHADFPNLRLFTVANGHAVSPQFIGTGNWSSSTAETAKAFSAVGFFFGRELHEKLQVPVGLISADYGGTVCEAWTSAATLQNFPDFTNDLALVARERDNAKELAAARASAIADWTARIESADGGNAHAAPELDDALWSVGQVPGTWTGELAGFDGFVWFRGKFDLLASWKDQDLMLELGAIDDMDFTFVNGTKIGQTLGETVWNQPRVYRVPHQLLNPGQNHIAVRVLDTGGGGGISGPIKLHPAGSPDFILLNEDWRYRKGANVTELPALKLPPQVGPNSPSVLFNAMIAPLLPFGIRGAIWYQGESNSGRDQQYRRLFPALIADWRKHWGEGDFPFYFTQIAPFRYPNPGMAAALRDAQRLSLTTPNTGMAITMDSDSNNLHPHTKQAVGHRLALWALAKTYGQTNLVYSGPLYRAMQVEGSQVRIFFDHVGSGLTSGGKPLEHFTIAGADGNFVPATAVIDGNSIVVTSAAVRMPVAVRYAWADADESSFANREGLPASSFRTDGPAR